MEAGTSALHQQAAELRTRETQGCRTQGSRTKDLNRHIYIRFRTQGDRTKDLNRHIKYTV